MSLPLENKYICAEEQVIHKTDTMLSWPNIVPLNNDITLYYQHDTSFNTPEIRLMLNISTNKVLNPKEINLSKLYLDCFNHTMNATLYNINCANYKASISVIGKGISIHVSGYPEKFMPVLTCLVDNFLLKDNVTEEIFNNKKNILEKDLQNYKYKNPFQMVNYELGTNVINNEHSVNELLNCLNDITYDDFLRYEPFQSNKNKQKKLKTNNCHSKKNMQVCGLVQGNLLIEEVSIIADYLSAKFGNYNSDNCFEEQLKSVNKNEFFKELENKDQVNSCFNLAIKIGYMRPELTNNYIEILSYLQVLNQLISEEYFTQLRTKEQLGYSVGSYMKTFGNHPLHQYTTYNFTVQSANKDSYYLKERTERFIKEYRELLRVQTEESINLIIKAQVESLQKPFQNLKSKAYNNFGNIMSYGEFDVREQKSECMKNINKNKLLEFYDQYFSLEEGTFWSQCLQSTKTEVVE